MIHLLGIFFFLHCVQSHIGVIIIGKSQDERKKDEKVGLFFKNMFLVSTSFDAEKTVLRHHIIIILFTSLNACCLQSLFCLDDDDTFIYIIFADYTIYVVVYECMKCTLKKCSREEGKKEEDMPMTQLLSKYNLSCYIKHTFRNSFCLCY